MKNTGSSQQTTAKKMKDSGIMWCYGAALVFFVSVIRIMGTSGWSIFNIVVMSLSVVMLGIGVYLIGESYDIPVGNAREKCTTETNKNARIEAEAELDNLIKLTSYGLKTIRAGENISDEKIQKATEELKNFFVKYQLPNNIRIATESLEIIRGTTNFETFFSRVDVCLKAINGWWASDTFLKEVEMQKIRLLRDSFEKLCVGVSELKKEVAKENRIAGYVSLLKEYANQFVGCDEYDATLQKIQAMITPERLLAAQKAKAEKEIAKSQKTEHTRLEAAPNEELFKNELLKSAGKYARHINFYNYSDGSIHVQYNNEKRSGPLNVGVVKLQGRAKYMKINNPDMGNNYDDVYRVDGDIDVLLPKVGIFVKKIENYEKDNTRIEKECAKTMVSLMGKNGYEQMKRDGLA